MTQPFAPSTLPFLLVYVGVAMYNLAAKVCVAHCAGNGNSYAATQASVQVSNCLLTNTLTICMRRFAFFLRCGRERCHFKSTTRYLFLTTRFCTDGAPRPKNYPTPLDYDFNEYKVHQVAYCHICFSHAVSVSEGGAESCSVGGRLGSTSFTPSLAKIFQPLSCGRELVCCVLFGRTPR